MDPYRTPASPAIPEVDPRVVAAIKEGEKSREEGLARDKAKLKEWFEEHFFKIISERAAQGGHDSVLTENSNPFCYTRFMSNVEAMRYVYNNFLCPIKGLSCSLRNEGSHGWFITFRW